MPKICFFPIAQDEGQLADLISRAAWFLSYVAAERIDLPVATAELAERVWRVAPGMDPAIESNFEQLRGKLCLVVARSAADLEPCMRAASVILRWRKDVRPSFVPADMLVGWEKGKRVFQVDPVAIRQEGSFYIEAGLHLVRDKEALIAECKRKFDAFSKRLGRFERAYVMATGPSVSSYKRLDYANSLGIVCNSVILDEELMRVVRPRVLVFADPIFHFGPSQYAGAFRTKMREAVERHDLTIFVPFKYYPLLISAMPELRERTIAVPFAKDREFNFDLRSDFSVKTTANILTFLMLPVAATFADEINVLGCDGRPLSENTYFWGHNPSTQINDKMANIREVHPGFFAIDYNDYYLEHCNTLEAQLAAGEAQGRRFQSVAFSYIPALRSRTARGPRVDATGIDARGCDEVVIVDPDGLGWSGHYMAYNDKMAAALTDQGSRVRVLCQRRMERSILAQRPNFVPALDTHAWTIGLGKRPDDAIRTFTQEMTSAMQQLQPKATPLMLYLYVGSFEHAAALASLSRQWPQLYVHVNLFYLPFRDLQDAAFVDRWRPLVEWIDSAGPRFVVTVPTREVQSDVLDAFGVLLDVAPHPSTGVGDEQLKSIALRSANRGPVTVIFPGGARLEKGYTDTVECVRLLGSENRLRTRLRHATTPTTPDELRRTPAGLPANCELVSGALDNDAFERFFREGDVVVLPYTPDAFAKRTSGLLIDALFFGLPSVVVAGTWLATLVSQYRCGVVVPDASAQSLRDGVLAVASDLEGFRARTFDAANAYFRENTWRALAEFTIRPLRMTAPRPRVLCIDLTSFDGVSATGRVKEALFLGWPSDQLLVASLHAASGRIRLSTPDGAELLAPSSDDAVLEAVRDFAPQVVYYRAVEDEVVHRFARRAVRELGVPHVVHIMDDWPQRLSDTAPERAAQLDPQLRELIATAHAALAISAPMAGEFRKRYGRPFGVFANAVDPASFPPRAPGPVAGRALRIAYTGALADDMTFDSVKDLALLLPSLPGEPVMLDIYTRAPWLGRAERAFAGNPRVKVQQQVTASEYLPLLQQADALLVAYNFNESSQRYVGLSRGNKVPESLASGTPVLAYGPATVAAIDELVQCEGAWVVSDRNPEALSAAIESLRDGSDTTAQRTRQARAWVFERDNVWRVSAALRSVLATAAGVTPVQGSHVGPRTDAIVGPFSRAARAHWDETFGIERLFRGSLSGSVMIDVGAHHGSALARFLKRGWQVYAFEPDDQNRAVLIENVRRIEQQGFPVGDRFVLDTRAASNESSRNRPFYRSRESTGISGLAAFHASHEQKQMVETVTLAEAIEPHAVNRVDFLKIDTEGFDLRVLQGFPWDKLKPRVVECEFEDGKTIPLGYRFEDLANFLVDRGYTVYVSEWHPVQRYGVTHDWHQMRRYPCNIDDPATWGNLLAFLEPVDEAELIEAARAELRLAGKPLPRAAKKRQSRPASFAVAPQVRAESGLVPAEAETWSIQPASASSAQVWTAVFEPLPDPAGKLLAGRVTLESNRNLAVRVALCRHGEAPYEGSQRPIQLAAGIPQTVHVTHRFAADHDAVRLQVNLATSPAGLKLGIRGPELTDQVARLREHLPPDQQTLAAANRMFRDGNYAAAMAIYEHLARLRPLRMYADNVVLCARRLGLATSGPTDARNT